jgi:hypothetical protein
MRSPRRLLRRSRDLLLVAATSGGAEYVVQCHVHVAPIRIAGAILLVTVLPGYALILGIGLGRALESLPRLGLAIGLGLASTILIGAALNLRSAGITGGAIATGLGALIAVSLVAAAIRERGADFIDQPMILWRPGAVIAVVLWIAASGVAVVISYAGAQSQAQGTHFTQLWAVASDSARVVTLGVRNHEGGARSYRLAIASQDGAPLRTWRRTVRSGATWTIRVRGDARGQPGHARLYIGGMRPVYRSVDVPDLGRPVVEVGAR